jgi:hypothetical protein
VKQHNVVEEQLHRVATTWATQLLKEPLQRAALDIALGAGLSRVQSETLNTQDLVQDLKAEHKVPFI